MYGNARRASRDKGFEEPTITKEWIRERLAPQRCELTGLRLEFSMVSNNPFKPSLDRIDTRRGYHPDNVRIVAWGINNMLNNWGDDVAYVLAKAYTESYNESTTRDS